MPIYERQCLMCGKHDEVILKVSERDSEIICSDCHIVMVPTITLPAKTATLWNAGWNAGLSSTGFYSPSVGAKVSSKREEAKIMEKRGFVAESDIGANTIERMQSKSAEESAKADAIAATYRDNLTKFGGDKIKAVTETFPAHKMLEE